MTDHVLITSEEDIEVGDLFVMTHVADNFHLIIKIQRYDGSVDGSYLICKDSKQDEKTFRLASIFSWIKDGKALLYKGKS